jgi:hypothetical protein
LTGLGGWYWIGVSAGLGGAIGVLGLGVLRDVRIALPLGVAAAVGLGYVLGNWAGAIAGGVGAVLGAVGATPVVRGTLARGGTRGGTAVIVAAVSLVLAALSFVPVLGYLVALAIPTLGVRLRRRAGERYAGLRILARD